MSFLTVNSLPEILFAHTFGVDSYQSEFKPLRDRIEITYISEGSLHCTSDRDDFILNRGDILFNTYTYPLQVKADAYHEHHTVSFQMQFSLSDTPTESSIPIASSLSSGRCLNLIDKIIQVHTMYAGSNLNTAGLCLQLLHEVGLSVKHETVNHGMQLYVKKAKNYIFQHIHDPIKQSDIAAALEITPEYLCYVFKQCEQSTVMSYVNRIKLESIRSLIEKENQPLYKAAAFYGYSDPNYVSRLYKKLFHSNITDGLLKSESKNTQIYRFKDNSLISQNGIV